MLETTLAEFQEFFLGSEDICGFHGSSLLAAEKTLDHESLLHAEDVAIVANPVSLRQLVNAIASLMDGDVAVAAKHNQVLVFIVPVVAD